MGIPKSLQKTASPKGIPGWLAIGYVVLDRLSSIEGVAALFNRISESPRIGPLLADWAWLPLLVLGIGWLWWVGQEKGGKGDANDLEPPEQGPSGSQSVVPGILAVRQRWPSAEMFHSEGDETYAYWLTGQGQIPDLHSTKNNIELLILPNPSDAKAIANTESMLGLDYDLAEEIVEMTAKAKKKNVTVKWQTMPFTGVAMTFVNPTLPEGWLLLDPMALRLDKEERPFFRMNRSDSPDEFDALWRAFQSIAEDHTLEPGDLSAMEEAIRTWYRKFGQGAMQAVMTVFSATTRGPFSETAIQENESGHSLLSGCLGALSRGDVQRAGDADAVLSELKGDPASSLLEWLSAYDHLLMTASTVRSVGDHDRQSGEPFVSWLEKHEAMREALLDMLDSASFDSIRERARKLANVDGQYANLKPSGSNK